MNEILKGYFIDDNSGFGTDIPVVQRKIFSQEKGEQINVIELIHTLKTMPFLDLNGIGKILNILSQDDDIEENKVSLFEVLNYHEVDYESLVRKRIIAINYSRAKIIRLIGKTVVCECTNITEILCQLFDNIDFLEEWNKLGHVFFEPIFMLDFYGISVDELYSEDKDKDAMIRVDDEDEKYKDMVVRFENFRPE